MATRNILTDGERTLSKKSREVTDFNKRLHILLDDMRETLIEANGLGLAAPQVGVLRRVALIVIPVAEEENPESSDTDIDGGILEDLESMVNSDYENIVELINPEIIDSSGEQSGSEGCLSVPGVYGLVTRPEFVTVRARDRNGEIFELEVNEIAARAVCHEIDHLNGVLFTSVAERILSEEELAEMRAERQNEDSTKDEEEKSE